MEKSSAELAKSWQNFLARISQYLVYSDRPASGLKETELARFEQEYSKQLPPALLSLYLLSNGQMEAHNPDGIFKLVWLWDVHLRIRMLPVHEAYQFRNDLLHGADEYILEKYSPDFFPFAACTRQKLEAFFSLEESTGRVFAFSLFPVDPFMPADWQSFNCPIADSVTEFIKLQSKLHCSGIEL